MIEEIRIHGRGGQGNVTASEFLAEAAFAEGYYAQSFPMFGSERHGAPVTSYVRISDKPIRVRSQIYEPDHVIIQDETLFGGTDVLEGLKNGGLVVVNSSKGRTGLPVPDEYKLVTISATRLAIDVVGKPVINTIMVGSFAGASNLIRLETLEESIRERYPGELGEKEIVVMNRAFTLVKEQLP